MTEEKKEEGKMEEEKKEVKSEENQSVDLKKRTKNYLSIIILLAGLLAGSVFVDVAQFVGRQGFSPRAMRQLDVIPFESRTWVAYNEPVVTVQVVNDSSCKECDVTDAVKMMKRVMPTLLVKEVQFDSADGKALIDQMKIKSLPSFVFDESVTKTDIYTQAQDIFQKQGDNYLIDTAQIGIQPGKFLSLPEISDNDAQAGPKDAKVKMVIFSDFQCPYCKSFYEQSVKKAMVDYKDQVLFVFKEVPLSIHDKAVSAAMAAECANEQGKFWQMADKLYGDQKTWSAATAFSATPYASAIGVNMTQFNQCVTSKKFQDKIDADNKMAQDFGISGTPAFFVNDKFFGGLVPYDQIKAEIDAQLAK
ncbi:MAG: DsbA family protein [Candidatus Moranbacteria bacterium]|nr:DsbA family protein [Candidatus Moranbacteria bacterium]